MLRQVLLCPHALPTSHPLNVILRRQSSSSIPKAFTTCSNTKANRIMNSEVTGREIDLLETKRDNRFNLPGNVGLAINNLWITKLRALNENSQANKKENNNKQSKSPIVSLSTDEILRNFEEEKAIPSANIFLADERAILHCDAHECPLLLIKDFQELFPRDCKRFNNAMTVLTITHKTHNDMSAWTTEVDSEREQLLEKFVATAKRMCSFLVQNGFWADFVDPCSGRPFYGDYTPATFFETDDRYRHFGFEIVDLGCCKLISHQKWGTKAFVGALFTNAPIQSDAVQGLLIYMDD